MKAVPISITLLCILILCIIINVAFISSSEKYMLQKAQSLRAPDTRGEELSELETFWEKRKDLIGLSVSNITIDQASDIIICLREAYTNKDEKEFQKNCGLLEDIAKNIGRGEKLTMGNIF